MFKVLRGLVILEERMDQMTALQQVIVEEGFRGYDLNPQLSDSTTYQFRNAIVDDRICQHCWDLYGEVYLALTAPTTYEIRRDSHNLCRCFIAWMRSILAGTATVDKKVGADYVLKNTGELPEYYMSMDEAKSKGWKPWTGNLWEVLPGICVYDEHKNRNGKLPFAPERTWYEADINYHGGFRNSQRLLISSDGLIFASYDHYKTYFQIA